MSKRASDSRSALGSAPADGLGASAVLPGGDGCVCFVGASTCFGGSAACACFGNASTCFDGEACAGLDAGFGTPASGVSGASASAAWALATKHNATRVWLHGMDQSWPVGLRFTRANLLQAAFAAKGHCATQTEARRTVHHATLAAHRAVQAVSTTARPCRSASTAGPCNASAATHFGLPATGSVL